MEYFYDEWKQCKSGSNNLKKVDMLIVLAPPIVFFCFFSNLIIFWQTRLTHQRACIDCDIFQLYFCSFLEFLFSTPSLSLSLTANQNVSLKSWTQIWINKCIKNVQLFLHNRAHRTNTQLRAATLTMQPQNWKLIFNF